MTDITTDDCKKKLVELYPGTQIQSWKRTKKSLNSNREVERVFECTQPGQTRNVVLVERAGQLFEVGAGTPSQATSILHVPKVGLYPLPTGLALVAPTAGMNRLLFGANRAEPLAVSFVTPQLSQMQFLLVLQNTIDWNAAEKERASYDFAKAIDFKDFAARCTVQGIDLLGSYLAYMSHRIDILAEMDEETFIDISADDYDDSLTDMVDVFKRIRAAFIDNKGDAPLDKHVCKDIVQKLNALKQAGMDTYGDEDEEAPEAFKCIQTALAEMSQA